jgi:HlyD family secretion protein
MLKQGGKKAPKIPGSQLLWWGALAAVGVGAWFAQQSFLESSPDPVAVRLVKAELGTVEITVNASGTVQLQGQQTLQAPAEGAVEKVWVQPGDRIQAGQVLVTLRNPERQTALSTQDLKITQQTVALTRNRQKIVEAQEQLKLDQQRLQSLRSLSEAGAIALSEVQEQETQVRRTLGELRTAEADARTAALELQNLRLEQRRIQQQLDNTVITAPIDGIVLGVNVKDGDGIELRTELLTIGNPSEELVQLQLSTLNAAQVRVNQIARVSIIGPNAQVFTGRVQSLYPQAVVPSATTSARGGDEQSGQATVPTTVQLTTPTRTLIPGGQVSVEIVLKQRTNVVTLGVEAVQRSPSAPFVWVMDRQNAIQQQPITIGLEGLTTVEITSGLKPGTAVVLPPPDAALTPGTIVTPES